MTDELTDDEIRERMAADHEALKARRAARLEAAKTERQLKWQREVLAPQLHRAQLRLFEKIEPMQGRVADIAEAIGKIEDGELTTFRLYPPRKRKAQEPEEETT
jgi:hypothetical protein